MLDFDTVYRENRDPVYRYLRKRGIAPDIAEDITQDTFLRFNPADFRGDCKVSSYLCKIATGILIDRCRSAMKERTRNQRYAEMRSIDMSDPENAQILRDLSEKLTPTQIEICNMLANGHAKSQICEILEISGSTFDRHMMDIRLRAKLLMNGGKIASRGRPRLSETFV